MPKFSIIIPCYNASEHINKCMESLENQTYKDFEIIIIDDKSTDNSYKELNTYIKKSKLLIKLLSNEQNSGAGETRNKGIQTATGKYITFLDIDDYIEPNTFEELNNIIENNDIDCIIFDYYYKLKKTNLLQKSLLKGENGFVNKSDALIYTKGSTWGKVYLLDTIKLNNIKFPNLNVNEDMVFNKTALSKCNKIFYLEKPLYHYILNENSLINQNLELAERNAKIGFGLVEKELKKEFPKEVEAIFVREYLYSGIIDLLNRKEKNKQIIEFIENSEKVYPEIYENEACKYLTKYQKIVIYFAKKRFLLGLKLLISIKKIIQKIR